MGKKVINFFCRGIKCKWGANNICNICNLNVVVDIFHFFPFNNLRNSLVSQCYNNILIYDSRKKVENIYYYITSTVKIIISGNPFFLLSFKYVKS